MAEDTASMGRLVVQFAGEILAGEMQAFVQASAPLGAVGHIVDQAFVGYIHAFVIFTVVQAQFSFGQGAVWNRQGFAPLGGILTTKFTKRIEGMDRHSVGTPRQRLM